MADRNGEDSYRYDAFVCHSNSEKDRKVVNHITNTLERSHKVRLCLPGRDMSDVTDDVERSQLIQNSCERLMIMLSPDLTEDSIRHVINSSGISLTAASRRIVLIMIDKPCNIPETLKHFVIVDYTRAELREWFFTRLAAGLNI